MGNKDVFQVLKNLSLVDLITIIAENSDIVVQEKSSNEVYYTAKELIKLYPNIFSKYKINASKNSSLTSSFSSLDSLCATCPSWIIEHNVE